MNEIVVTPEPNSASPFGEARVVCTCGYSDKASADGRGAILRAEVHNSNEHQNSYRIIETRLQNTISEEAK